MRREERRKEGNQNISIIYLFFSFIYNIYKLLIPSIIDVDGDYSFGTGCMKLNKLIFQ